MINQINGSDVTGTIPGFDHTKALTVTGFATASGTPTVKGVITGPATNKAQDTPDTSYSWTVVWNAGSLPSSPGKYMLTMYIDADGTSESIIIYIY
jgi:hypothetical protein